MVPGVNLEHGFLNLEHGFLLGEEQDNSRLGFRLQAPSGGLLRCGR